MLVENRNHWHGTTRVIEEHLKEEGTGRSTQKNGILNFSYL